MAQPLHIKNAFVWDGFPTAQRDLYTSSDGQIADKPANGAMVVDLDGYTIFPGLINAHDHLELNHYPRSKFRERYDNAHQWGEDMNVRLDTEPYKSLRAYPLEDKLFIGGLKNLLCGATTVAHHGPPHKPMFRKDFPVRVLQKYGWAHSLHFDTDEEVVRSYRNTPKDWPWFIHLAEGTDEVAAGEYQRLKELGCVGKNTVIVHGVGLTDEDIKDAAPKVRALVWCPTTNYYLLDVEQQNHVQKWIECGGEIALGSDSRLTANGDFLEEYISASSTGPYDDASKICGYKQAQLFGVSDIGFLVSGAKADWFIGYSAGYWRWDIPLIIKGGIPQIGDPDTMAKFPHVETVPATLDSKPKAIHRKLAERIWKCTLHEKGLEIAEPPRKKYILF